MPLAPVAAASVWLASDNRAATTFQVCSLELPSSLLPQQQPYDCTRSIGCLG